MARLALGETSSCTNPVLDVFTQVNGVLTDLYSLEFQVFDATGGPPIQVYPATVGDRQDVNVTDGCPVGHRLSVGHYVAEWTVPPSEPVGTHLVRWYFMLTPSSQEQQFAEEFEVLSVAASSSAGYCLVQDLCDEGVTEAQASDQLLQDRIAYASRFIDACTRRWFEPRWRTYLLDGPGHDTLFLDVPIVGIDEVAAAVGDGVPEDGDLVDSGDYRVYNRHLSQGLTAPDDRDNPKLVRVGGKWPRGRQNVRVTGAFGYTEVPHGSATSTEGVTPELIRRCCVLLVLRDLAKLSDADAQADAKGGRVVEERTRDQSYKRGRSRVDLLGQGGATAWTDDPEINGLLDLFRAPPVIRTTR